MIKHLGIWAIFAGVLFSGCVTMNSGGMAPDSASNIRTHAQAQHPGINFEQTAPEAVDFRASYNAVWMGIIETLFESGEQVAVMDKDSGFIRTEKSNLKQQPWTEQLQDHASFSYTYDILVKKQAGKVNIQTKIPFWEETLFSEEKTNLAEGSSIMRHIFYWNLDRKLPGTRVGVPVMPVSGSGGLLDWADPTRGTVITSTASYGNIRIDPSPDARIFSVKEKGTTFTFLENRGNWYHVALGDGREGWAHKSLFRPEHYTAVPATGSPQPRSTGTNSGKATRSARPVQPVVLAASGGTGYIVIKSSKKVGVFKEPFLFAPEIGTVSPGKKLRFTDRFDTFYRITYNGKAGYVYGAHCRQVR